RSTDRGHSCSYVRFASLTVADAAAGGTVAGNGTAPFASAAVAVLSAAVRDAAADPDVLRTALTVVVADLCAAAAAPVKGVVASAPFVDACPAVGSAAVVASELFAAAVVLAAAVAVAASEPFVAAYPAVVAAAVVASAPFAAAVVLAAAAVSEPFAASSGPVCSGLPAFVRAAVAVARESADSLPQT